MKIGVSKLGNGLKIATRSMPQATTISLGIWINAGSRDENEDEQGIAHMLEHMAFKGTKTRTALQIAERAAAMKKLAADIAVKRIVAERETTTVNIFGISEFERTCK